MPNMNMTYLRIPMMFALCKKRNLLPNSFPTSIAVQFIINDKVNFDITVVKLKKKMISGIWQEVGVTLTLIMSRLCQQTKRSFHSIHSVVHDTFQKESARTERTRVNTNFG